MNEVIIQNKLNLFLEEQHHPWFVNEVIQIYESIIKYEKIDSTNWKWDYGFFCLESSVSYNNVESNYYEYCSCELHGHPEIHYDLDSKEYHSFMNVSSDDKLYTNWELDFDEVLKHFHLSHIGQHEQICFNPIKEVW